MGILLLKISLLSGMEAGASSVERATAPVLSPLYTTASVVNLIAGNTCPKMALSECHSRLAHLLDPYDAMFMEKKPDFDC
jgi:hypothetical protein